MATRFPEDGSESKSVRNEDTKGQFKENISKPSLTGEFLVIIGRNLCRFLYQRGFSSEFTWKMPTSAYLRVCEILRILTPICLDSFPVAKVTKWKFAVLPN